MFVLGLNVVAAATSYGTVGVVEAEALEALAAADAAVNPDML